MMLLNFRLILKELFLNAFSFDCSLKRYIKKIIRDYIIL